ncbi:MAG: hypothetical protein LBI69_02880 [Puniceicoccales bacterium]|jgi:hypothetical protein|nr:hypothetical protein [Puniceicoccales bacterium]
MSLSTTDAQMQILHTADLNDNPPADDQTPTGPNILGVTQDLLMTPTPADDYEAVKARFFRAVSAGNDTEMAVIFRTDIAVAASLANEIDSLIEDSGKTVQLDSETIANLILTSREVFPGWKAAILGHDLLDGVKAARILLDMDSLYCQSFSGAPAEISEEILEEMCRENNAPRAAEIIIAMCERCGIEIAVETLQIMLLASEASTNNNAAFILNYVFDNSSDKMIIVEVFSTMDESLKIEILANNQTVCEILVRTLCDESMSCENLVTFFDEIFHSSDTSNEMLHPFSKFRDIAYEAIVQIESKNVTKATACLEKLNVESVAYIFAGKLKSTDDALIFWKKIQALDQGKVIEVFRRVMENHNLTESLVAFLLEKDRRNFENPGTFKSASAFLLCEDFNLKDVAKILTCSLIPEEKLIEIIETMYRLNNQKTVEIFIEVVAMGVRAACSGDIGVKIFLKMEEIDSQSSSELDRPYSIAVILATPDSPMESFVRYTFFQSNLVDINRAAKILKDLHEADSPVAAHAFRWLLEDSERKAVEIFLKLYQSEVNHQVALDILSDPKMEHRAINKLLLSDSLGDATVIEILKDLCKEDFQLVVIFFDQMITFTGDQDNRMAKIFLQLYQSEDSQQLALEILSDVARKILTDSTRNPQAINKFLLSDSLGDATVIEILKDLCKEDFQLVVIFFNQIFKFADDQNNRMAKIFLQLYQSEDSQQLALEILSDAEMKNYVIGQLLVWGSVDDGNAVEILKKLHGKKPAVVVEAFNCTHAFTETVNKIAKIFLQLYQSEVNHQVALDILSDPKMEHRAINKLLISNPLGDGKAVEILKKLYGKKSTVVANVFNHMPRDNEQFNRMAKIFLELYQTADWQQTVMQFLFDNTIVLPNIVRLLLSTSLSDDNAVEILKKLHEKSPTLAMDVFKHLINSDKMRVARIFLKFYQEANWKQMAMSVLFDTMIKSKHIARLLLSDSLNDDNVVEILEKLHGLKPEMVVNFLSEIALSTDQYNRRDEIFTKLCNRGDDHRMALEILSNSAMEPQVISKLLLNGSLGDGKAVEILKKLYDKKPTVVENVFNNMPNDKEQFNGMAKIFLELYQTADWQQIAMRFLSDGTIKSEKIMLLLNAPEGQGNVVEILKALHEKNSSVAVKAFDCVGISPEQINGNVEIFLQLYRSENGQQLGIEILSDNTMTPRFRENFLRSNSLRDGEVVEILKALHEKNSLVAVKAFNCEYNSPEQINGNVEIFLQLYNSENDQQLALEILSDDTMAPRFIKELLLNNSLETNVAAKISKDLHAIKPLKVVAFFNNMYERFKRKVEIFRELYQSENDHQVALEILFDAAMEYAVVVEFLMSKSLGGANAAEILKKLNEIKPSAIVNFFNYASSVICGIDRTDEMAKIFLELYQSENNHRVALESLSNDAMEPWIISKLLASNHISPGQMANILTMIYTSDAVNKIAQVLEFMRTTPESKSKVANALRQMDPDKVDSLLNTQFLRPYVVDIRSMMERIEVIPMHRHEEEFAICFHALNAAVEQVESESTDIPQNVEQKEDIPAGEFPLAENTPRDEVPLSGDADDGKISLEEPKIPPPSRLERFREFFNGTAGKVFITVVVAAISGLVLWAVTLWPLAALIGAGCTAVALGGILFFRNRSANGSKSQEVNPLNFDGDDPHNAAEDRGLCI